MKVLLNQSVGLREGPIDHRDIRGVNRPESHAALDGHILYGHIAHYIMRNPH